MRYLIDTHALIWWWLGSSKLPARARAKIVARESEICVSPASIIEIAIKVRRGQLGDLAEPLANIDDDFARDGFTHLPITYVHAREAGLMQGRHRDPFDRILAAQALIDDLTLITRDPLMAAFGCRTLWR